jgi:serine/threonine protein phosphatase 1
MIYAIGDIHGCYKTLQSLLQKISNFSTENTYYFLGDYIDRGPASKEVLDFLIEFRESNKNVNIIRGNHEQMMIDTYKKDKLEDSLLWKQNGSGATLKNFNVPVGNRNISDYIPIHYINFAESLPYYIETEKFFLVHGGFNFQNPDPFSDTHSMLWTRDDDYSLKHTKGKTIIHGHTTLMLSQIIEDIKNKATNICIDSGCVYKNIPNYGYLSALDLETMELISVENIDF